MDMTPKYIKMCEKAEEIQMEWKKQCGDYCVRSCEYDNYRIGMFTYNWCYGDSKPHWTLLDGSDGLDIDRESFLTDLTWLPSQDQLQEMLPTPDAGYLLCLFWNWVKWNIPIVKIRTWSLEQMWFAFIMKNKYNKVWVGEEWRNKDDS